MLYAQNGDSGNSCYGNSALVVFVLGILCSLNFRLAWLALVTSDSGNLLFNPALTTRAQNGDSGNSCYGNSALVSEFSMEGSVVSSSDGTEGFSVQANNQKIEALQIIISSD